MESDRDALLACTTAYARGIDRCDEALIRSAFHADAHFDNGDFSGALEDFVPWLLKQQEGRALAQHYLTNSTFELEGDTAHGETYFLAVLGTEDRDGLDLVGGRYIDRFERRDGRWAIASRVLVRDWRVRDEGGDFGTGPLARLTTRDRGDISYKRPL